MGAGEQRKRDGKAKRLGGLHVDDQLELGRRLHRQFGRLLPFENSSDIFRHRAGALPGSLDSLP